MGASIPTLLAEEFDLAIGARYGPIPIAHPIGKASGQLSLQPEQVRADAEAGLGFVVLKTVIAEDRTGHATMGAWKVRAPRMIVEPIAGRRVERRGWTVTWAGRGWEGSLAAYLQFLDQALRIGAAAGMPVIPSCKYHLASEEGEPYRAAEYRHTTAELLRVWTSALGPEPLVVEQDFSPTLAGADPARSKERVLDWLRRSPALIKADGEPLVLGVKLMNALFEDEFQLSLMRAAVESGAADFLVVFNRLFDPERTFGSVRGVAYGGPDLSDRNLSVLRAAALDPTLPALPLSATGDITSGRVMAEYALAGAVSGQAHTFFQLPARAYTLKGVSRTRAALHELYFHPREGLVAAMLHVRSRWGASGRTFSFLELPAIGRRWLAEIEARR